MAIVLNGTSGITNDSGYTGDGVSFADSTPANTLVTTSGGNVGIGTSSPLSKVHIENTSANDGIRIINSTTGEGYIIFGDTADTNTGSIAYNHTSDAMTFDVNNAERARIDSAGNFMVGCTDLTNNAPNVSGGTYKQTTGNTKIRVDIDTRPAFQFYSPTGGTTNDVGRITVNASSTAYTTTSDYRAKENIQPMQNALATVAQLNPVTYTWKIGGSVGQGFIAHELQAVVPECVIGEKDAVDAEGNPQYQGIDTSFLVATLTAAIQELKAEVDSLKAQINGANA